MKKIIAFLLVVSMTAAIAVGGTLAYLTDRESEANVFTTGDVEIDLKEDFTPDSALLPGVTIDKKPTITNVGPNNAWVWATVSVPAKLDSVIKFEGLGSGWDWNTIAKTENVTIEGKTYNQYTILYDTSMVKDDETSALFTQVTLDPSVDIDPDGQWHSVVDGDPKDLGWNNSDGKPVIYVNAYAIQQDQFADVKAAYAAYNQQWGDNGAEYGAVPVDVSSDEELATAIADGATILNLKDGTYHMPAAAQGKTLTINGTKNSVIEVVPAGAGEAGGQLDYSLDGSNVTFNGVTIKTNSQLYAGYARLSATYNDCVIQNTYNLGIGNSEFNNCTFNITNEYLRVGGASSAVFNGCTFNTDGRAILVFQDGTSVNQTVTVKDCTFNATAAANTWNGIHVAAVSIDGTAGTYVVNLEGTNTVDADFSGLWQIKAGEANVTVNE